ncbi:MAG: hypothetical protein RIE86_01135 [Imperialibacter sp.]|uniref:hypothetical protein n=1 Tax=Imperialibacter sp. TaxID=2038411 RepID=UPI0032EAD4F7
MAKQPDFKETTSLQQYRSAIDFLQTHIQLLDASLIQIAKLLESQTNQELDINKALGLSVQNYDRLNHPCKQQNALVKHSQKKNIEFAILRLFNLFTAYLQNITKEMFAKNPMLVVGKAVINKNGEDKENLAMSYAEIVRLSSYENIQEQIVLNVFRSIEELKSTSKLLEKILKDTKVNISKETINGALTFLEMRHLFIHNHGLVDNKYAKTYGKSFTPNLKDKKELPTKFETFSKALAAITKLITEIDGQLISNGMVGKRELKVKV